MNFIKQMLMDQKFYESSEEIDNFLNENKVEEGSLIQSFKFDIDVFAEEKEVAEWLSNHYFEIENIENIKGGFEYKFFDITNLIESTTRELELRRGVKMIIGSLKSFEAVSSPFTFSLRNEKGIKLDERLPHIIELAKVVSGYHNAYGQIEITKQSLKQFEKNFNENAVGVDISIDYDHETREAAGWLKSVWVSFDGSILFGEVKWTPKGALSLSDREFRYFSPEFSTNYIHPHTGVEHGYTLLGGALVNRPFLKMEAIVELKSKNEGSMDTIKMSEHKTVVATMQSEIDKLKLSENTAVNAIKSLKEKNEELSIEVKKLNEAAEKIKKEAENKKLFNDGKINAAQLKALNEGKSIIEILSLSEKMNTEEKGSNGSNDKIALSEADEKMRILLGLSKEEYLKANPVKEA